MCQEVVQLRKPKKPFQHRQQQDQDQLKHRDQLLKIGIIVRTGLMIPVLIGMCELEDKDSC